MIPILPEMETELQQLVMKAKAAEALHIALLVRTPDGTVRWMNDAFEKLLGYGRQDLRNRNTWAVLTGKDTDQGEMNRILTAIQERKNYQAELTLYRKDGRSVRLAISGNFVTDKSGWVIQENQMFQEIPAGHGAEHPANGKALAGFLASLGHEMAAPLNSMIALTELMSPGQRNHEQAEHVQILRFLAINLKGMLSGLRHFSGTSDNKDAYSEFSLDRLLADTIGALKVEADRNQTQVWLHHDLDVPARLTGDETHLFQILYNLLGNAIKFTRKGEVRLKVRLISRTKQTVRLGFEVTDTGIGIPEHMLKKIFSANVQATPGISRQFGGSGLGLAIVKDLLKQHGSAIRVMSEQGKGSRFFFNMTFNRVGKMPGFSRIPAQMIHGDATVAP